jgi:hypothetical protein
MAFGQGVTIMFRHRQRMLGKDLVLRDCAKRTFILWNFHLGRNQLLLLELDCADRLLLTAYCLRLIAIMQKGQLFSGFFNFGIQSMRR